MTRHAAVLGWPINHSRSPLIHGTWIAEHGLDATYTAIAVDPDGAPGWFETFADHGLVGANVTIPHKETALAACDHVADHAARLGAVNTLWLDGGKLHGTSTDGEGFMANLADQAPNWSTHPNASTALVLGAGGAARAIIDALLGAGVDRIIVLNRSEDRAQALTAHFARHFGDRRIAFGGFSSFEDHAGKSGLLINTTALGMQGQPALDVPIDRLADGATVADIVYTPLDTPLLTAARERNHPTVDGLGMLLHQAVPGFERWFGVRPTVTDALRQLVLDDIQAKTKA
ncbi:MAG: shikimate dehydrogenase [Hyphomicrobiales bacterium]|jgi:shikimate dehydrogenase